MNKLDELIQKLCPNGVEYYQIIDVFEHFNGMNGVSGKWNDEGNCYFIDYLNVYKNLKVDVNRLENATVKKMEQHCLCKGDILLTCASETPDECAISSVIEDDIQDNVFLDDHLFGLHVKEEFLKRINASFVNYYMHTPHFRKTVKKAVRGVTRFYISNDAFEKLQIPVPPLEVQCAIVHILDNFTQLTAELKAELAARKKQYEYYLNVCFGTTIEEAKQKGTLCKLADIGEFQRGKRFCHRDDCVEGVPAIHYGELYTHYGISAETTKTHVSYSLSEKMRYAEKNDVIIVGAGENRIDIGVGVAWFGDEKVAVHDACYRFRTKQKPKFIAYYLRSKLYHNQIFGKVSEGKICAISADAISTCLIGLPSLKEQQYIVDLLDKFDSYCNYVSKGLPAEIEARQKQYEYYRDKLLTFKRLEQ